MTTHHDQTGPTDHPDQTECTDDRERGSGGYPNCELGLDNLDPARLPDMPAAMLEGLEQRRTEAAEPDDPGELYARLAGLRARIAAADGDPTGTPPGGWATVGREQAARELATRGIDQGVGLDAARGMVTEYLNDTAERAGLPDWEWGLDQGDLDAIAAEHRLPTCLGPVTVQDTDHDGYRAGDEACADDMGWLR